MYRMIKFELYRMIHSFWFWTSIAFSCLLAIISSAEQLSYYLQGMDHISVFYRWIGHLNLTYGSHYLFIIVPLLSSIAYSPSGGNDRKSGYIQQIISRISRKKYFVAKYLVTFLSGGVVFASAILLNYMLLALFMPADIPVPESLTTLIDQFRFCSKLFYTKPYLFVLLWLLVVFLWGGAMATIGLSASMIMTHTTIAVLVPFGIFLGEGILGTYLTIRSIFMIEGLNLNLSWTDMLFSGTPCAAPTDYIIMTIILIITVSSIVYWVRVWNYECI